MTKEFCDQCGREIDHKEGIGLTIRHGGWLAEGITCSINCSFNYVEKQVDQLQQQQKDQNE